MVTRGYVLSATDASEKISDEMPYPVYSSQTKDNGLMGYYSDYLYEDAITWTTDGANAGTVNFKDSHVCRLRRQTLELLFCLVFRDTKSILQFPLNKHVL